MERIFTIEIHETWMKKVKVRSESRSDAESKAYADYIDEYGSKPTGIAHEEGSVRSNVEAQREWPDGNPVDAEE